MKIDDSNFFGKKWVKICLTICILKSFLFLKVLSRSNKTGNPGQLWRNAKQF